MKKWKRPLTSDIARVRKCNAWVSAGILGAVLMVLAVSGCIETNQDKWLAMRTRSEIALQKTEFNGIYWGEDGYFFVRHAAAAYTYEQMTERIDALEQLTLDWDAQVCLVPTADNIVTDKLPLSADVYDDTVLLRNVWERIGMDHYIDVYSTLLAHKDEEIYYRTDEHWTSLGAYYAYLVWAQAAGVKNKTMDVENPTIVSDNYIGSLPSQSGLSAETADSIWYYTSTERRGAKLEYDGDVAKDSFYNPEQLEGEDAYAFFLDGDHEETILRAGRTNGRTLLVVKDSWANCLLPMIAGHYETVIAVDPTLLTEPLSEYMERCARNAEDLDVLVIYSCDGFLETFDYE